MLPDSEQLERYLRYHREVRDIGSIILLVGVIAEILIDNFWEYSHPPLLRGPRATTLLTRRTERLRKPILVIIGLLFVAGGISLEWRQGTDADDIADTMRANLEQANHHLEARMLPRRLTGDPMSLAYSSRKLSTEFGIIPLFVQTISDDEAKAFGDNIVRLEGYWDAKVLTPTHSAIDPKDIFQGVTIYRWYDSPSPKVASAFQGWLHFNFTDNVDSKVVVVPPKSQWALHRNATFDDPNWPFDKLKPLPPRNALLVLVGKE